MAWHVPDPLPNVMRLAAAVAVLMTCCGSVLAQTPADALLQRELVVGTKEAAPFAMKSSDGSWTGLPS
mgnify:FL=1